MQADDVGSEGSSEPGNHFVALVFGASEKPSGPAKDEPPFLGERGYDALRFEEKLPIFGGGRAPNLDAILSDGRRILAIESRLCEHLKPGQPADFEESYRRVIHIAHASWRGLYEDLLDGPRRFTYLDAAQLVRHYLGLKTQTGADHAHAGKTPVLLYLYWEPIDAGEEPACQTHREEVAELEQIVDDPGLAFRAMSYSELWDAWRSEGRPTWLATHLGLLEERYAVRLADTG